MKLVNAITVFVCVVWVKKCFQSSLHTYKKRKHKQWANTYIYTKEKEQTKKTEEKTDSMRNGRYRVVLYGGFASVIKPAVITRNAHVLDHVIPSIHFEPHSKHLAKWIEMFIYIYT